MLRRTMVVGALATGALLRPRTSRATAALAIQPCLV